MQSAAADRILYARTATPITRVTARAWHVAVRCGLALLSAGLLTLAFPNADQGWLAWVALAPLLVACHGLRPLPAAGLGLVTGAAAALGVCHWMFEVPGFGAHHAAVLGVYLGLYPAAWCAALPRLGQSRVPLIVSAPALWVVLDYARAHAGFLAAPWATLAQSQHRDLAVLQIAAFAGEYGVTLLVVMGSVALANIVTRRAWRSGVAAAFLIAAAHSAGALALGSPATGSELRVAVVQPNIRLSERETAPARAATLDRLERLSRAAAATRPALIVWPETAVRDLARDPALVARVQALAQSTQSSLVVGASESVKFAPATHDGPRRVDVYNAAYVAAPGKPIGAPYRKMRLVPFGEYVPLEGLVRWPAWLVPRVFESRPGDARRLFSLPDGTQFAVLICWENLFADFVRPSAADGAQLLVQLTNDNWFGPTAAPRQHNLASVLRAVENRVPVVIASNTGPSEIIDAFGRVVGAVPDVFVEGTATAAVRRGEARSVYTRLGDWMVLASLGVMVVSLIRQPKEKRT